MQKMFTMWSVILDSVDIFWGGENWKLWGGGNFPPEGTWIKQ